MHDYFGAQLGKWETLEWTDIAEKLRRLAGRFFNRIGAKPIR
jgi:hypothetical protein